MESLETLKKPDDIIGIFCQKLKAETFQHKIDISIAVRQTLHDLIDQKKVSYYDEDKNLKDLDYKKLVNNYGFVSKNNEL